MVLVMVGVLDRAGLSENPPQPVAKKMTAREVAKAATRIEAFEMAMKVLIFWPAEAP
jgi:hypothetical protein